MAITQTITTSFKEELLYAVHNFGTDTFKIALYTDLADLGPNTTAYTTSGEVSGGGYGAGGLVLTGTTVNTGYGVAYVTFNTPITWSGVTFTAYGALIYNSSKGNKSVAVYNFGQNMTAGATNVFNLVLPADTAQEALIRVA